MRIRHNLSGMKAMIYKVFIFSVFFFLSVNATFRVQAQDSLRRSTAVKKPKPRVVASVFDRRVLIIDSLEARIEEQELRQDSLIRELQLREERLNGAKAEMEKLRSDSASLRAELEAANGDKLQSSHTSSVLFIFNVGVGIFLLIAIIWMFMRRRNEDDYGDGNPGKRTAVAEDENFDHKLDRIQKLGNLRDKGLLTEDEFNFQKKQILGE